MRNLKILRRWVHPQEINCTGGPGSSPLISRGDNDCIYACEKNKDGEGGRLVKVSMGFEGARGIEVETLCEDECLKDVFKVEYIASTGVIYLGTVGGTFLQAFVSLQTQVQEVFQSEQGISYFAVSPDSRLVAITTKINTLLLLTLPDLECIAQHELENVDLSIEDVSICWRQDSRYFAVNIPSISGERKSRKISFYEDTGSLYSSTEDVNPVFNSTLAWQPSGGLISAVGKTPHGDAILFFELNGLKRSDFLPSSATKENTGDAKETRKMLQIDWNVASDIFAIRYSDFVELWTRSNYVWMKKKILNFSCKEEIRKISCCLWDAELPYRLYLLLETGTLLAFDMAFSYDSGISGGSAITASINGGTTYCTAFRENCAPPPFGFYQTNMESCIASVVISNFWDGILCISYSGTVRIFKREKLLLVPIKTYQLPSKLISTLSDNWIWPNKSTLCSVNEGNIVTVKLTDFEQLNAPSELVAEYLMNDEKEGNVRSEIGRIHAADFSFDESNFILVEEVSNAPYLNSYGLKLYLLNIETLQQTELCKCRTVCTNYRIMKVGNGEQTYLVFGLDSSSRVLFGGWSKYSNLESYSISTECCSFTTFNKFLLVTTVQGSLEITDHEYVTQFLNSKYAGLELDSSLSDRKCTRKVEKGSIVVSCCLNQMLEPSLVLEIIPRGNLETIFPRPLLISSLRTILTEKSCENRYEKVMTALRRHRVDYRILIDEMKSLELEDPTFSLKTSLNVMVEQVKNSHSLVLLITDLNDSYRDCIQHLKERLETEAIKSSKDDTRMQNIEEAYLASLAKLGLLEEALKSPLIEGEDSSKRSIVKHRVNFLSYYCDNPDILFDTAIGTYDLTLASLVADCLGKDPKEYLPILETYKELSDIKRMFKIDDKLRRYYKACVNLIKDDTVQHDEILKYMERHRLFTDIIDFVDRVIRTGGASRNIDDLSLLLQESKASFGRYLEEHNRLKEASILYRGGGIWNKAVDCAIRGGLWELGLDILHSEKADEDTRKGVYDKILNHLEDNQSYADAARFCEVYLSNLPKSIDYWIRARQWIKAKSLAQRVSCSEDSDKYSTKALILKIFEAAEDKKESINSLMEDVVQKVARLKTVKEIKARKQSGLDDADGDAFSDVDSVSTSTGSFRTGSSGSASSGKSFRSSKNKRKHEKKLYSMKEGSTYEDLGITVHLWTVFEKIQHEVKRDTSQLIEALWIFELNDLAIEIGSKLDNLLQECNKSIQEIWSTVLTDEILEMKFRIPPTGWSSTWEKLCLHESSSKAGK